MNPNTANPSKRTSQNSTASSWGAATLLGFLALTIAVFAIELQLPILTGLWLPILWVAIRFTPVSAAALSILFFSASTLLLPDLSAEASRVLFLSTLLLITSRLLPSVPAFYVASIGCLVAASNLTFGNHPINTFFPISSASALFIELGGVLTVDMLASSRKFRSLFRSHSISITLAYVLRSYSGFFIFSTTALLVALLQLNGQFLPVIFAHIIDSQEMLLIASCLLLTALVGSGALARTFQNFLGQTIQASVPNSRLMFTVYEQIPILEFQSTLHTIRKEVDKNDSLKRLQDIKIGEVTSKLLEVENKAKTLQETLGRMTALSDSSPYGFVALNGKGSVFFANKTFGELLKLDLTGIESKHANHLTSTVPWMSELKTLFCNCYRNYRSLLTKGTLRFHTTPHEGYFLEVSYLGMPLTDYNFHGKKKVSFISAKDMAIFFYIRKVKDIRDYARKALEPASSEIIGSLATELCRGIGAEMQSISSEISKNIENLSPENRHALPTEVAQQLKQIQLVTSRCSQAVDELIGGGTDSSPAPSSIDISSLLQSGLDYVTETLSMGAALKVYREDYIPVPVNKSGERTSFPDALYVKAHKSELDALNAHLVSLLFEVLPRSTLFRLRLGTDDVERTLSPGKTQIPAGRYARIEVYFESQNLELNSHQPRSMRQMLDCGTEEAALQKIMSLLTFQIKRMSGYTTVETNPGSDSTLTFFLPSAEPSEEQRADTSGEASDEKKENYDALR